MVLLNILACGELMVLKVVEMNTNIKIISSNKSIDFIFI